jgi:hypothetical protein
MSSKSAKETTVTSKSVTSKHILKISHFSMDGEEGDDRGADLESRDWGFYGL